MLCQSQATSEFRPGFGRRTTLAAPLTERATTSDRSVSLWFSHSDRLVGMALTQLLALSVNESAGNELLPAFTVMAALTALVLAGVGLVVAGLRKSSQQAQRLAEETAQTSELILNSAAEGIFCVDRNGRITMANPAGREDDAVGTARTDRPRMPAPGWGRMGWRVFAARRRRAPALSRSRRRLQARLHRVSFSEKMVRVST